jgi:hypothetical protein
MGTLLPPGGEAASNGEPHHARAEQSHESSGTSNVNSSTSPQSQGHNCQWVGCSRRPAFPEAKLLLEHLLEEHCEFPPGSPPLLCTCWWVPCEYFAKYPSKMRAHMLSHVAYYPYVCKHCGTGHKYEHELRHHEKPCGQRKANLDAKEGKDSRE